MNRKELKELGFMLFERDSGQRDRIPPSFRMDLYNLFPKLEEEVESWKPQMNMENWKNDEFERRKEEKYGYNWPLKKIQDDTIFSDVEKEAEEKYMRGDFD